jgi:DUF4097 and DUF4098 domain-containing protein YvlB
VDERGPAARDGTVKITNAEGTVRVTGWYRDSVAVTGTLGAGAERLEFSTDARETKIRVLLSRDAETVEGSELEVRVPRFSYVAVRTSAAEIEVVDVGGGLDLESVSGGIRVSGNPRMVYAESAGGDVHLEVATKIARAKTLNGDVTVLGARGFLEVSTVSGDAIVTGEELWEGSITSVSGNIRYEGDFQSEGSFSFESHSGIIELALPARTAADFRLTTFTGVKTENDFAPADARSFAIGGGGTLIQVRSFKGTVRILKGEG